MHRARALFAPNVAPSACRFNNIATAGMCCGVVATRIRTGAYDHAATEYEGKETGAACMVRHYASLHCVSYGDVSTVSPVRFVPKVCDDVFVDVTVVCENAWNFVTSLHVRTSRNFIIGACQYSRIIKFMQQTTPIKNHYRSQSNWKDRIS